jgi:hypothetical protein
VAAQPSAAMAEASIWHQRQNRHLGKRKMKMNYENRQSSWRRIWRKAANNLEITAKTWVARGVAWLASGVKTRERGGVKWRKNVIICIKENKNINAWRCV